jgi:aspartate dehydrogenase
MPMRVGLIGGGTIGRLIAQSIGRGEPDDAELVAILGRGTVSRGRELSEAAGAPYVTDLPALLAARPEVVVEAASHEAVREYCEELLEHGIAVIVLSAGALAEDALRERLEQAARRGGGLFYVPSGGIGGLDALKAAMAAGVDEVKIAVTKPPAAWKNIDYVESLGVALDHLREPRTLYSGPARAGVPLFPANVNIAAVLSLAGIGFDRTILEVVADPRLTHNTHTIDIRGRTGNITIRLENVPAPDNPKTAWLACYSALAALALVKSRVRYGT